MRLGLTTWRSTKCHVTFPARRKLFGTGESDERRKQTWRLTRRGDKVEQETFVLSRFPANSGLNFKKNRNK